MEGASTAVAIYLFVGLFVARYLARWMDNLGEPLPAHIVPGGILVWPIWIVLSFRAWLRIRKTQ